MVLVSQAIISIHGLKATFFLKALVWSHCLVATLGLRCGQPGRIVGSLYTPGKRSYNPGEIVRYICNNHTHLISETVRRCGQDGTWSGHIPVCYVPGTQVVQSSMQQGDAFFNAFHTIDRNVSTCSSVHASSPLTWEGIFEGVTVVAGVKIIFPTDVFVDIQVMVKDIFYKDIDCGNFSGSIDGISDKEKIFRCPSGTEGYFVYIHDFINSEHEFQLCEVIIFTTAETQGKDTTRKYCIQPDIPDNGRGFQRTSLDKTEYSYTCNYGYQMLGAENVTCLPNGTWTPGAPVCLKIFCQPPEGITNGNVTYDQENGIVPFRGSAKYRCINGFALQGVELRECKNINTWSSPEPICIVKRCGQLQQSIANGRLVFNVSNDVAHLVCNEGYRSPTEEKIYCLPTGEWTNPNQQCAPIQCEPDPTVLHGKVILLDNSTFYGSRLQIICSKGYVPRDPIIRMCEEYATWGQIRDICTEVSCDAMKIENGQWATLNGSSSIRYLMCYPGHYIDGGPPVVQCLYNGSWSYTSALCSKMFREEERSSDWSPSIMIITAIAVGAATAVCLLCLVMSLAIIRKRQQSKTKVFHFGMANSTLYAKNTKRDDQFYNSSVAYEEVAEVRSNLRKPRKPHSALPRLPCDADPVYAQPFETASDGVRKISRGIGNKEDHYAGHIYAEPIDSRRPNSRTSDEAECLQVQSTRVLRKMSLPDCKLDSQDTDLQSIKTNSLITSHMQAIKQLENRRKEDAPVNDHDRDGLSLSCNSLYLKRYYSDYPELHNYPELSQMTENDIYLNEFTSDT